MKGLLTAFGGIAGLFDCLSLELGLESVDTMQGGNEFSLAAWNVLCGSSRKEFQQIYDILHILA